MSSNFRKGWTKIPKSRRKLIYLYTAASLFTTDEENEYIYTRQLSHYVTKSNKLFLSEGMYTSSQNLMEIHPQRNFQ